MEKDKRTLMELRRIGPSTSAMVCVQEKEQKENGKRNVKRALQNWACHFC